MDVFLIIIMAHDWLNNISYNKRDNFVAFKNQNDTVCQINQFNCFFKNYITFWDFIILNFVLPFKMIHTF